jgi:hypothetical protein
MKQFIFFEYPSNPSSNDTQSNKITPLKTGLFCAWCLEGFEPSIIPPQGTVLPLHHRHHIKKWCCYFTPLCEACLTLIALNCHTFAHQDPKELPNGDIWDESYWECN